jgi:hypothetical protein
MNINKIKMGVFIKYTMEVLIYSTPYIVNSRNMLNINLLSMCI